MLCHIRSPLHQQHQLHSQALSNLHYSLMHQLLPAIFFFFLQNLGAETRSTNYVIKQDYQTASLFYVKKLKKVNLPFTFYTCNFTHLQSSRTMSCCNCHVMSTHFLYTGPQMSIFMEDSTNSFSTKHSYDVICSKATSMAVEMQFEVSKSAKFMPRWSMNAYFIRISVKEWKLFTI